MFSNSTLSLYTLIIERHRYHHPTYSSPHLPPFLLFPTPTQVINNGNTLCVSNQASLRSVIRVGVGAIESESSVPCISSGNISRAKVGNHGLSSGGSILSSLVGTADVGQLVVDSVGDDGWVKGLLLSLVDEWVNSLEGGSGGSTTVKSKLELHGGHAKTEVESGDGGGNETIEVSGDSVGNGSGTYSWRCADES
jgi:hypothetical protein